MASIVTLSGGTLGGTTLTLHTDSNIVYEDASQTSTQSITPVELKLSLGMTETKTYTVQYSLGGNGVTKSFAQIYVDSNPIGILNEISDGWQLFSENINCDVGSVIQIFGYVEVNTGQWCMVKNFVVSIIGGGLRAIDFANEQEVTPAISDFLNSEPDIQTDIWSKKKETVDYTIRQTDAELAALFTCLEDHGIVLLNDSTYQYIDEQVIITKVEATYDAQTSWAHPWLITLELKRTLHTGAP